MARMLNSFALLGDEEGDDMTVLVENFAKKVDVVVADPAAVAVPAKEKNLAAANQPKSQQGNVKAPKFQASEFAGRTEGGRGGRGRGAGRGGFGRNDGESYGNEQENGGYRRNWDESKGNGYDDGYRGRGRGRGGGRGRGRGRFNNEPLVRDEKEGSGDNTNVEDADGWEQVPQTHSRGYVNYANNRDEERPFRDGNRNYGGERRGYGGGNREFRPRRDGGNYGRVEQENNEEVKEENKETADGVEANVVVVESDTAIAEGDAAAVTEEPKDAGAEEKTQEEGVKAENPIKKEEDEDENLMTLEEYEKLVAEKRKALEAQKIEVRTVTVDKDFEAMQLLQKKKEEILLVKPEAAKLKKKESLEKDEKTRKTLSINEFLKPADGEEFVYRRPGRGRGGRGGRGGGDLKTGERGGRGGEFRTGERGGRGGEFRTGERGGRGGGDFRSGDRGFGNNYPRGGGRSRDGPVIPIADQSQFPTLKGSAPAVEAA